MALAAILLEHPATLNARMPLWDEPAAVDSLPILMRKLPRHLAAFRLQPA